MDAGKPQIGAVRGPSAATKLTAAVAEGHERLAPPVLRPSAWSVTTQEVVNLRENTATSPKSAPALPWIVGITLAATFGLALLGWTARQHNPPAFSAERPLQALYRRDLPPLASSRSGTNSMPARTPEALKGLASVLIEPSKMASLSPTRATAGAPLRDAGERAPDPIMVPAKRSNAGLSFSFLGTQSVAAATSSSAGRSRDLLAEMGDQKLDPEALIARGDDFMKYSDVTSARLFYKLAASNGSAAGAIAMGSTYDPIFLERGGVRGVRPEPKTALSWYRIATELGDQTGKARSAQLLDMLRRDAARGDPQAKAILESWNP